jgi:L-asparaginase II
VSAADPLVVEVERSGLVESTHAVDVAVARRDGTLVAWAGDVATVAYLRSSAKPIQALACLEHGWRPSGIDQVAISCASHNGEAEHVDAVHAILGGGRVDEHALRCPPAWPALPEAIVAAGRKARIYHNCSGKHAAMLATSRENGWPLDDYREVEHPMQRAVAAAIERLAGRPARHIGIDGCGVPTFALTLGESARAFAQLGIDGREALDAMAAQPFLVAGTGRLCTAVMSALPGVAIKIGAEGSSCGVLREHGLGFALKSRDGTQRARDVATVELLKTLGVIGETMPEVLAPHAAPAVPGGDGTVGTIRCRGLLQRA